MWNYFIISHVNTFRCFSSPLNSKHLPSLKYLLPFAPVTLYWARVHAYTVTSWTLLAAIHPAAHADPWPANNYKYLFAPLKITVLQWSVLDGSSSQHSALGGSWETQADKSMDNRGETAPVQEIFWVKRVRLWSTKQRADLFMAQKQHNQQILHNENKFCKWEEKLMKETEMVQRKSTNLDKNE